MINGRRAEGQDSVKSDRRTGAGESVLSRQGFVETRATERGGDPEPTVTPTGDEVQREDFSGCTADISLITILGRGHPRPGDPPGLMDEAQFGTATSEVVAADLAWEWFEEHPLG